MIIPEAKVKEKPWQIIISFDDARLPVFSPSAMVPHVRFLPPAVTVTRLNKTGQA
jgi:hypothetical protein